MKSPLVVFFSLYSLCLATQESSPDKNKEKELVHHRQNCETFLAPSSVKGGGWGVYAGRDFEEGEVVELSPRFIPIAHQHPVIINSVLDDYKYAYLRWDASGGENSVYMDDVVFGNVMFFNHHSEPNVEMVFYGTEPGDGEDAGLAQLTGAVALQKIEGGEELFLNYGEDDGGRQWFNDRGLELVVMSSSSVNSKKNGTVFEKDMETYCSKLYAGIGRSTWEHRILAGWIGYTFPYKFGIERLAPEDHPDAIVNQDVTAGTILELSPALVLSKTKVVDTPLAPICFFWEDWDGIQKKSLRELRESNDLTVQHQDDSTDWVREDHFRDFEDVVLLPAAGNIGLVQRVERAEQANCMLNIKSSGSANSQLDHGGGGGSTGILLELVATTNMNKGERLKLNIPVSRSRREHQLLAEELQLCGQPIPDFLQTYIVSSMRGDEEL